MSKKTLIFDHDTISHPALIRHLNEAIGKIVLRPTIVLDIASFRKALKRDQWDVIIVDFCQFYFRKATKRSVVLFAHEVRQIQKNDLFYFLGVVGTLEQKEYFPLLNIHPLEKGYFRVKINELFGISSSGGAEADIPSIQKIVCEKYGVPYEKVQQKTRKREVVKARQVTMFLSKMFTKKSLKSIGEHFGGRDHTTVIHSCQTVKDLIDTDEVFHEDIREFVSIIKKWKIAS